MPYEGPKEFTFSKHYEKQNVNTYYKRSHELDKLNWPFFSDLLKQHTIFLGVGRGEVLQKSSKWFGADFNRRLLTGWKRLNVLDKVIFGPVESIHPDFHGDFDFTASCDFLEHVDPDMVDEVMDQIVMLAPKGKHIIDTNPQSSYRGVDNANLHCSANDMQWWLDKFLEYFPDLEWKRVRNFLWLNW